jgi:glutathione S-transferase
MEFGYWKIRGLGAVFRMLLEYKQAEYTDKQYESGEDWFKGAKPAILEKNALANLPYLVDGDVCICQTNSILNYLGEKFGMNGSDAAAKRLNDQLLNEIYDVRNAMIDLVYAFKGCTRTQEEYDEKAAKLVDGPPFAKFEAVLTRQGTDYFCGSEPCTSDFHIFEMLDQHKILSERVGRGDALKQFAKCWAFYERFRALPGLQKYFESPAYTLPINNPIAAAYLQ